MASETLGSAVPIASRSITVSLLVDLIGRWDQVSHFHRIDLGKPVQPLDGDRPLAAFVGAQNGRLELVARGPLHLVERPSPSPASRPESFTQCPIKIVQFPFALLPRRSGYHGEWPVAQGMLTELDTMSRHRRSGRGRGHQRNIPAATIAAVSTLRTVRPSPNRVAPSGNFAFVPSALGPDGERHTSRRLPVMSGRSLVGKPQIFGIQPSDLDPAWGDLHKPATLALLEGTYRPGGRLGLVGAASDTESGLEEGKPS